MKRKSFYFEDYTDSELLNINKTSNVIRVLPSRVAFIFFIFICLVIVFSIKITYLSLLKQKNFNAENSKKHFIHERRNIVDRNGSVLATNVNLYDLGVRPKLLNKVQKKNLLIQLKILFPNIKLSEVEKKLDKNDFFWIKKRLTPKMKEQFWLMGNKAFIFESKPSRIYPQKNLFSHVLGQTDNINEGISGIEKFFDNALISKEKINLPFELTLDSNLQYLIREELIKAKSDFNNIGSAAILMEVETGEVLSLVSLPDYDLNQRAKIEDKIYSNKITLDVYELGSVFKTFTIAAGLENKVIEKNTILTNLENKINCDKHTISEHDPLPANLSIEQILVRSSNIGSVRIAQRLGVEKYKNFLNSLDLLVKAKFHLHEVGVPLPIKWGKCKLATASFGRGITTTPLQLARAYAVLGNGGYKVKPQIIKNEKKLNKKREQIISSETSDTINSMLRNVVALDEGTANFANIEGFDVAGKTGSSVKYKNGAKLNTFVALFPSKQPKYVLLVMLDEPKSAPNFVYNMPPSTKYPDGYKYKGENRNTSGWNTVVVAGKIIKKIGPILAINNLEASKNF